MNHNHLPPLQNRSSSSGAIDFTLTYINLPSDSITSPLVITMKPNQPIKLSRHSLSHQWETHSDSLRPTITLVGEEQQRQKKNDAYQSPSITPSSVLDWKSSNQNLVLNLNSKCCDR